MAMEVTSTNNKCARCGLQYSRHKGYFPVSYAQLYKGYGYIPVCRECIDKMYSSYLSQCNSPRKAVRQVCRKLDLYWSDRLFEMINPKSTAHTIMTAYISKLNTATYVGRCYDDTLLDEGTLWDFSGTSALPAIVAEQAVEEDKPETEISQEVKDFWGTGYTSDMYEALEQRRSYWMSRFPSGMEMDIGTEAIIRQICSLELDINRDRAAGKAVDKNVNALNTLLGSASLKPAQKKDDLGAATENTPLGVWIKRWEDLRPLPEPDPELKDPDNIVKYISVWFLGHLCKMLNIKNTNSKLYEDEIAKYKVERPEFDDEDDEVAFNNIFAGESEEAPDDTN